MEEPLTHVTIVEKPIHKLFPGEVTFEKATQSWYVGCPGEYDGTNAHRGAGSLASHDWMYDGDKKLLTISPSILCYKCGAHYYIRNNIIEWVT